MLLTDLLTVSACPVSSCLIADSTLATMSKFNPFCRKETSASLKDLGPVARNVHLGADLSRLLKKRLRGLLCLLQKNACIALVS